MTPFQNNRMPITTRLPALEPGQVRDAPRRHRRDGEEWDRKPTLNEGLERGDADTSPRSNSPLAIETSESAPVEFAGRYLPSVVTMIEFQTARGMKSTQDARALGRQQDRCERENRVRSHARACERAEMMVTKWVERDYRRSPNRAIVARYRSTSFSLK